MDKHQNKYSCDCQCCRPSSYWDINQAVAIAWVNLSPWNLPVTVKYNNCIIQLRRYQSLNIVRIEQNRWGIEWRFREKYTTWMSTLCFRCGILFGNWLEILIFPLLLTKAWLALDTHYNTKWVKVWQVSVSCCLKGIKKGHWFNTNF